MCIRDRYTIGVVIQNTRESKKVYGADVAGTVFKRIADHLYKRFLNTPLESVPMSNDTIKYFASGKIFDFQNIFNFMEIPFKDSATNGTWRKMSVQQQYAGLSAEQRVVDKKNTPNVEGLGLKDALEILESSGFRVVVSGRGKVATQSYAAGKPFLKGQQILLILN